MNAEIEPLYDIENGECIAYFAKGDFTPSRIKFVEALNREYQRDFQPEDVKRCYARCVPIKSEHVDHRMLLHQDKTGGAFMVTFVEMD